MIRFFYIFLIILIPCNANASITDDIISNLSKINNLNFSFIQTINGKDEKGQCTIQYPKKMYCKYDTRYNKILVSNGNSLVIKTEKNKQFYRYQLKSTPLFYLLDKKYILKKITKSKYKIVDNKFYMFSIKEKNQNINIFFSKKTLNLLGWQTEDLYQNLSVTYIYDIEKNSIIDTKMFELPKQNF